MPARTRRALPTLTILVTLATLVATPTRAQDRTPPPPVASVEGIQEYRLDNGLRVLLFPDPSQPQITVNVTYLVGSRHEGYGETGMAHLLEHLLFKGTPNHPDIMKELTERGAQPNGTTYYDRTNYFETFPASEDNLGWALGLEADRMLNAFISAEDLESEMTVVRNEMESGENSPLRILVDRTLATAYLWHGYGRSTIGARSDVENVPIERLQAFYRKHYQPDNAVLIVAGDFQEETALRLIGETFGRLRAPDRSGALALYPTYTREPTQDGERRVTLRRAGSLPFVTMLYHIPPGAHPDFAAVDVLAFILGDAPSGRLYRALVETKAATQASASAFQLREPSPLLLYAVGSPEQAPDSILAAMEGALQDLFAQPITEDEVERARTALLNDIERSFSSSAHVALQFSEWASMGDWRLFFLHRDRIAEVTAAEVNRVARAYLKPDNRTVGTFVPTQEPDRAEVPPVPDVEAMVRGYEGRAPVDQGEAFDPSPANIEARTRRFTLPNGMAIALLPKETRADQAVVQFRLHFGDEPSLNGRTAAGDFVPVMIMRGTERHSRQEIQDELDRLRATGGIQGGAMLASGQFQAVRETVPDVIRLLAELFREPTFPREEFETLKRRGLASIQESRADPGALARNALARAMEDLPQGHPSRTMTPDEEEAALSSLSVEDVAEFHGAFWGPQRANLVVVGDFDEAEVRRVIDEAFSTWQSPHPFQRIPNRFYDPPGTVIEIETPDKANAAFYARQNLELRDTDPDYPALALAGYMIGGGFLNSRLARRVREEDGLSYGIGADIAGHPIDRVGQFAIGAIAAPENVEALQEAVFEVLREAMRDGFTDEEVTAAKQGWLEGRRLARAQDGELASLLSDGLYLGRGTGYDQELEDRVRALTPEAIHQAVRTHLDPERLTIAKAGDFARARAANE